MDRLWLCVVMASLCAGCLDFAAAESAFCATHACTDAGTDAGVTDLDTTLTATPGPTSGPSPEFDFVASQTGATFECRLGPTETNFTACTSPKTFSGLPPRSLPGYLFQVRARLGSAVDATPAEQRFAVIVGPSVVITAPTNNSTVGTSVTLTFNTETGVTYVCQLDSQTPVAGCTSGHVFTGLTSTVNPHHITLTGTDAASRSASQTVSVTVDDMGPGVTIAGSPGASGASTVTHSQMATFTFTPVPANEPAPVTYQCQLDSAAAVACTSPYILKDVPGGLRTLTVTATDRFGNTGAPAKYTWTITASPQSIYALRHGVAEQTLVLVSSSGLKVTGKAADRFWMQEGVNPYEGITVAPLTSMTSLAPGVVVSVTGTVAQVHGNLTLTHATFSVSSSSTPYDSIYANRDVNQLLIEANEGMYMAMGGQVVDCTGYDFCITSCENPDPVIDAYQGFQGTPPDRDVQFGGVVEGASATVATSYTYFVTDAVQYTDACL